MATRSTLRRSPIVSGRSAWVGWPGVPLLAVCLITGMGDAGTQPRADDLVAAPVSMEVPAASPLGWTGQCSGCHDTDGLFSHPVGVAPSMSVPAGLPLVDGEIGCITCHDDRSAEAHLQARHNHSSLLRGPGEGAGFCSQCHDPNSTLRRDMHALMVGRAHLRWPQERGRADLPLSEARAGAPFDPDSETCLGCHDGSVAIDVGHGGSGAQFGPGGRRFDLPGSHPIGVEYSGDPSGRGGPPLKPAEMLDERIRLFDSRVGCGTCHSLYSRRPGLLVMSNSRSTLCLNCHDL
jgi:predicted CXXCH cytochrome family protein